MEQKFFIASDKIQAGDGFFLNSLKPDNLCPFAAHSLYPYFFGLKRGSWFRWSRSKDEVITQCPNPSACVAFRVKRAKDGEISATVIALKGKCLAGHQEGEIFKLAESEKNGLPQKNCCDLNSAPLLVRVVSHSRACRYYKKPGTLVAQDKLVPQGFCLPAYFRVYPSALSLLYDGSDFAQGKNGKFNCLACSGNNQVELKVETQRNIFSPLMNLIEKILRFVGWPKDALDKEVKITPTKINSHCPKNLELDQIFNFNLRDKSELCPAVFYNFFPYWAMLAQGIMPYWGNTAEKEIDIHCPDAGASIVHKLKIDKDRA